MQKPSRRWAWCAAVAATVGLFSAAPFAASQAPQPPAPASQAAPAEPEDPFHRETPRGAFLGFVEASQRGNRAAAAEYLQWPRQKLPITREDAADQLVFVLNHGFEGNLDRLSRDPAGAINDGLAPDRERAGAAVLANGERVEIHLTRVQQAVGPAIWLVAADTVADIPRMYEHAGLPQLERRLPKWLTAASFGELSLWVPLALVALIPVLYAVSKLCLWTVV
jgi:MscS family membrane protein